MKRALFVAMITVSMLCAGLIQMANAQSTTGVKVGMYVTSWNFAELPAQTIASYFDLSQSCYVGPPPNSNDYTAKMNQVHSLNPAYKFLMYVDCLETAQFTSAELNNAMTNGWILKDSSGKLVSSTVYYGYYITDIGNPAYQQWFASRVKAWLGQYPAFDGVFADNSMKCAAVELQYGASAIPINPRTGTYWTDAEIVTACQGLLNAVANAITPKLLCSNGVWNGNGFWGSTNYRQIISGVPGLNTIFSEGTWAFNYGSGSSFWYSESVWVQSLNFVIWAQTNFLSGHPERHVVTTCLVDAAAANLPPSTTRNQIMMFGYCSELLGAGSVGHNDILFGKIMNYPDLIAQWQTLNTTDLGNPLATYYKVNGTSVYARDFVNGKVMVNPSSTSYTVALSNTFKTLNGQLINSINIQPHTGVILTSTTPLTTTCTLSIIAASGGTTTPGAGKYTFNLGNSAQVLATPASGYTLTGWIFNGAPYQTGSPNNPLTVSIFQAVETIQPVFTASVAATLLSDGFESTSISKWMGGGATIVTSPVHSGAYAAQCLTTAAGENDVYYFPSSGYSHLFTTGYFNFRALPTGGIGVILIALRTSAYGDVANAGLFYDWNTGKFRWGMLTPSGYIYTTDQNISPNTWYYLGLEASVGASGVINLYVNGTQVLSYSGNTGTTKIQQIWFGEVHAWEAMTTYLDDCVIAYA